MKQGIVALVVIVILAIGGWAVFHKNNNQNNSTAGSSNTSNASQTSSSAGTQTPASTNAVTIQNLAFSPANITVKKGTTVTWTNKDSTAHTVTGDSSGGPKSDQLSPGQSYSFTFSQAGTFNYHCTIHTEMTGTVTVTDTSASTNNSTSSTSNPAPSNPNPY
jgi:plastocyanin